MIARHRLLIAALLLVSCRARDNAMLRGDRFWADSNYLAALAEYRLAERQTRSPAASARVAHAYILTGQFDRGRRAYERLLKAEPGFEDQAVYDYVWLANTSVQRGDRYGAARAAEAALELRPGLKFSAMALTLARHYATMGDNGRADRFFQDALESAPDSARPALLYEVASHYEQTAGCLEAIRYFQAFSESSQSFDSVTEARYRMGTCGLEEGRNAREGGQPERALELLAITLDLGAPQNLLDQAWFERAEALVTLGRMPEAAAAFERVIELSRSQLGARAQRRLGEIRTRPVP